MQIFILFTILDVVGIIMISSLNELEKNLIDRVKKDYEISKMSISKIAHKYSLDRNVVLAILGNQVSEDLPNGYINKDTFIVISDTHIGSEFEKIQYLDYVYEFAIKNNIKDIVHAGDVIQSTYRPVQKRYVDQEKQIIHLVDDYPYDNSLKNHLLFGNHDYHTLAKNDHYMRVISRRNDFHILGFKRAYLNWQKSLICVDHPIQKYNINIPNYDPLLRIIGHSHSFHIGKPNNIYSPSLCLDHQKAFFSGFLVISRSGENISITLYTFNDYIANIHNLNEIRKVRTQESTIMSNGVARTLKMRDNTIIGKR